MLRTRRVFNVFGSCFRNRMLAVNLVSDFSTVKMWQVAVLQSTMLVLLLGQLGHVMLVSTANPARPH